MLSLLPTLLLATATAPTPTVWVAPAEQASALRAALAAELPSGAVVPEHGDLRVYLTGEAPRFVLRIEDAAETLLSREITSTEDKPGLRVAVLLVVEVYQRQRTEPAAPTGPAPAPSPRTRTATAATQTTTVAAGPPPSPGPGAGRDAVRAPPRPEPPRLWLSAGGASTWWTRPGTALLGLQVSARYAVAGPLSVGGRLAVTGLCCHLSATEPSDAGRGRVDADVLVVWALVEAQWTLMSGRGWQLAPTLGLGAEYTRALATATRFVGEPLQETRHGVGLLARAGLGGRWLFAPGWAAGLGAGALLRSPRTVLRLPEPFDAATADLDPGPLGPWLELSLSWGLP